MEKDCRKKNLGKKGKKSNLGKKGEMEEKGKITTKNIDHLGIVSGVCDDIGLVKLIDELTESDAQRKVSVGTAVKAMVLNGLGFANRTLYLTPLFFKDKAVDVLLGEEIKAEDLNSHSLGTALDSLYYGGVSRIFFNVSLASLSRYRIEISNRHLDGTTFLVHGNNYEHHTDIGTIEIKRGYNKQKRHDLRQFVFELISGNKEGIPLFMKPVDGNETDKTVFIEVIEEYLEQMKSADQEVGGHVIADSALYTNAALQRLKEILWISRVPHTIGRAKKELAKGNSREWQDVEGQRGYQYVEIQSDYGGIDQRWFLIKSEQAAKRGEKTVEKNVKKELSSLEKRVKQVIKPVYKTEQAAQLALENWFNKGLKKTAKRYHKLGVACIESKGCYARGRRGKDAKPLRVEYNIKTVQFDACETSIEAHKLEKSQFILATNDMDQANLSVNECLDLYKNGQQQVERGFRFLKDPLFILDRIFLELPRRIMALCMVMGLCLLIYTLAQYKIRKALKKANKTVPDQLKKEIQNPTMRWIFQLFKGIHVFYLDGVKKYILNLNEVQIGIIKLLGANVKSCYTV